MPATPTPHVCFAAQFMRADGTPADRTEYFSKATSAQVYAERSNANGARVRHFKMAEVAPGAATGADATRLLHALESSLRTMEYIQRNHGRDITGTWKLGDDISKARALITEIAGIAPPPPPISF